MVQILQPLDTEYVDRRFDGTKVSAGAEAVISICPPPTSWHRFDRGGCGAFLAVSHSGGMSHPQLRLQDEYFEQLRKSSTLYIGNLSFYTSEDQVGNHEQPNH